MMMSNSQSMAKKHTWKGEVVEDRSSPSRFSLDSGFSSFPASPSTNNATVDAPPSLIKCDCDFFDDAQDDLPPPLLINCSLSENNLNEDDEPLCKMPRLYKADWPIAEEEEDEVLKESEKESSPVSLPLSVPEKELDEPKPENATVPSQEESTSVVVKAPAKRVRISTPEDADENADPYAKCFKPQHPCLWDDCTEEFFDVNDLYDHTLEQHFDALRPSDSTSAAASTSTQRRRIILDDKEEEMTEQKYRCQWLDCETSLKRGTAEKKFEWLRCHFHNRHAPKAQPYKCLMSGCPIRFQTTKTLQVHLLHAHVDRPVKKTQQVVVKPISCYEYSLPIRIDSYNSIDFFDKHTFELIGRKVQDYYDEAKRNEENTDEDDKSEAPAPTQSIPCMTTKRALKVLRKVFYDKMN